ncbi:TetR/AcrR family transcriptional regulator [Actinopolymorpha alba]|uniref:TetR/AcrR family transcriptional regulator n=1 Tax=Actinopolymorpha alba TaxID=533267 RepID=UPI000360768D|nr:TetR/AcrR family transcriptional regulator [Actinopolymorpha alba]
MTREPDTAARRRLRADAERNVAAILDAATERILRGGEVNLAALARAAGVSRVTLYTHFPTREALLEAVVERCIAESRLLMADLELHDGTAKEAMARLVRSQWRTLDRYRTLYTFAATSLPPARLRTLHAPLFGQMRKLVARGQDEGVFRTDLPQTWLIATIYGLMHQAAEEVNAGRLSARRAGDTVTATVLSALTAADG